MPIIAPDQPRTLLSQPGWVVTGGRAVNGFGSKPVQAYAIEGSTLKLKVEDCGFELNLDQVHGSLFHIEISQLSVRRQQRKKHLWESIGEWEEIPTMHVVLKLHNPQIEEAEILRLETERREREAREREDHERKMQVRREAIASKVNERLEERAIVTVDGFCIKLTFPDGLVLPIRLEDDCECYHGHSTAIVFDEAEEAFNLNGSQAPNSMFV